MERSAFNQFISLMAMFQPNKTLRLLHKLFILHNLVLTNLTLAKNISPSSLRPRHSR